MRGPLPALPHKLAWRDGEAFRATVLRSPAAECSNRNLYLHYLPLSIYWRVLKLAVDAELIMYFEQSVDRLNQSLYVLCV